MAQVEQWQLFDGQPLQFYKVLISDSSRRKTKRGEKPPSGKRKIACSVSRQALK
jgi:hypothetical protein